jgi:hypothetical protein
MDEITDSLERALNRIDDFRAIHEGRLSREDLGPVLRLQESVAIGDSARSLFRDRICEAPDHPAKHPGEVLFGVLVGLLAAQLESERSPTASGPG